VHYPAADVAGHSLPLTASGKVVKRELADRLDLPVRPASRGDRAAVNGENVTSVGVQM
jgi:hypothetical protein